MNRQELVKSLKKPPAPEPACAEQHFRPKELAARWGISAKKVIAMFKGVPGVVLIGQHGSSTKRSYTTMLIPASIAERVYLSLRVAS